MKRKISLILIVATWLLMGCTSEEQQFYTEALERAKVLITEEKFTEAKNLLQIAVMSDYEDIEEATDLLDQLTAYESLADLLSQGQFSETLSLIDDIAGREDGSPTIRQKTAAYKEDVLAAERDWLAVYEEIEDALLLAEEGDYEESNRQLTSIAINLTDEAYYQSVKTEIFELIAEHDERVLRIQEEELKEKTNDVTQDVEDEKDNLYHATDSEVEQFIATYLEFPSEQLEISIYNRTDTSYLIEVQEKEISLEFEKNHLKPVLEIFKVNADGIIFQMDKELGEYIPLDESTLHD